MSSNFTWSAGPRFVSRFLREGWGPKLSFVKLCSFGEVALALFA